MFTKQSIDSFISTLKQDLKEKAGEVYAALTYDIPEHKEDWDMYHVVDLGKKLLAITQKVQKRFKDPILGYVSNLLS